VQRTGHGQYVETHWGSHYHTFLMGRPIAGPQGGNFCPLGRETGIEQVVWRDDWMYLERGGMVAAPTVTAPVDVAPAAPEAVRRSRNITVMMRRQLWILRLIPIKRRRV